MAGITNLAATAQVFLISLIMTVHLKCASKPWPRASVHEPRPWALHTWMAFSHYELHFSYFVLPPVKISAVKNDLLARPFFGNLL